jgi:hypothetical protein
MSVCLLYKPTALLYRVIVGASTVCVYHSIVRFLEYLLCEESTAVRSLSEAVRHLVTESMSLQGFGTKRSRLKPGIGIYRAEVRNRGNGGGGGSNRALS